MCLILFAYRSHPRHELIVAANRDEFYARPTQAMSFWDEDRELLAGRDLKAGGTWLGVSRDHRFAGLTNYRDPREFDRQGPSRGHLVLDFLRGELGAQQYLRELSETSQAYSGFNLITVDESGAYYYSNRSRAGVVELGPGVYGLSNHLLDTAWPKVAVGRRRLSSLLRQSPEPSADDLFEILDDRETPPDEELPNTGVGLELERRLASIFIESPGYGTRCSTVVLMTPGQQAYVVERTHSTSSDDPGTRLFQL